MLNVHINREAYYGRRERVDGGMKVAGEGGDYVTTAALSPPE